jgi:hypothetical protein
MNTKRKSSSSTKAAKRQSEGSLILSGVGCEGIDYDFDVPISSFKWKAFSSRRKFEPGDRWYAIVPAKAAATKYHIHFTGRVTQKSVEITVFFCYRRRSGMREHSRRDAFPYAEGFIAWLKTLFKEPPTRAFAHADFSKNIAEWRSRFNLPFKVTMAGREVVIEGVSLALPPNPNRVQHAFIKMLPGALSISLYGARPIDFDNFDIDKEVASFNDALQMIVEPL